MIPHVLVILGGVSSWHIKQFQRIPIIALLSVWAGKQIVIVFWQLELHMTCHCL